MLYIAGEDANIFSRRADTAIKLLASTSDELAYSLPNQNLPVICLPAWGLKGDEAAILGRDEDINGCIHELEGLGFPIRVIVFDTLTSVFAIRDENNNSEMQELMRGLREYGRTFDALVIVIAHPEKNQKRRSIGQIRGAGALTANADLVLEMKFDKRKGSDRRQVQVASIRDGVCDGEDFELEIVTLDGNAAIRPLEKRSNRRDRTDPAKSILREVHLDLLRDIEMCSLNFGELTTSDLGQSVLGVKQSDLVTYCMNASDFESDDKEEFSRRKDALRKQKGRAADDLVEWGVLEKYGPLRQPCFRPVSAWHEMTGHVRKLTPQSDYVSEASRIRLDTNANARIANPNSQASQISMETIFGGVKVIPPRAAV